MKVLKLKLAPALPLLEAWKDSDVKSILLNEYSNSLVVELFLFKVIVAFLKIVWSGTNLIFLIT